MTERGWITVELVIDGQIYSRQIPLPETFMVGLGPAGMHGHSIGPVSAALGELCSEVWQERNEIQRRGSVLAGVLGGK